MSLDTIKSTILAEAKTRAERRLAEAGQEAGRLIADGKAAAQRNAEDAARDMKLRLERETNRELERIQYENRLHILSAKNKAIDEVFKRVRDKIASLSDDEYVTMIGKWLAVMPSDASGVLRVNPRDERKFAERLTDLNRLRQPEGQFKGVIADPKVSNGALLDGPDYNIDCTLDRRLAELRDTAAGDLARALFGA